MIKLRDYQQAAVDAIYTHFEKSNENALIVIPTAGGKTPVLASFLNGVFQQWPESKVLALVHVKELLAQAHRTLKAIWPQAPASIYSAGLGQRNLRGNIVFATIQSIYKKAYALQSVDLIIVDEVDLVPHEGEGMYRKLFADLLSINPHVKVIGLTATPWRMNDGLITEGKGALFSSIAYEVDINTLIKGGWICPPIAKTMDTQIDTSGVSIRGGEFVAGALEKAADKDEITKAAVAEIIALGSDRVSWLVFASGIEHAHHIRDEFKAYGITCEAITGKTGKEDRELWIADYQAQRIKCLVNVSVLTVGFDAPATDLLAILRPTKSSRLWLQILGRGFRLSPETGKKRLHGSGLYPKFTELWTDRSAYAEIKSQSRKGRSSTAPHMSGVRSGNHYQRAGVHSVRI
jgi:DNA repair protein RadD